MYPSFISSFASVYSSRSATPHLRWKAARFVPSLTTTSRRNLPFTLSFTSVYPSRPATPHLHWKAARFMPYLTTTSKRNLLFIPLWLQHLEGIYGIYASSCPSHLCIPPDHQCLIFVSYQQHLIFASKQLVAPLTITSEGVYPSFISSFASVYPSQSATPYLRKQTSQSAISYLLGQTAALSSWANIPISHTLSSRENSSRTVVPIWV